MRTRHLVAIATVVVLGGCTGDTDGSRAPQATPAPTTSVPAFVRTCDSMVFGSLGHGWMDDAVRAGPVFLLGADPRVPAETFDLRPGRAAAFKVLAVVHGTDPVTIAIPSGVDDARLLYEPASFNARRLEHGQRAVMFEPCGGGPQQTQFNGGFVTTRPMCLPLDVTPAGGDPIRVNLPLGEPC